MITRIREVRRSRGMTLDDVARRCEPPTTPQTIGRLETGTRTVSIGWLNRIAKALGVGGAIAPRRSAIVVAPRIDEGQVGVIVSTSFGDYRSGDEIWCEKLEPE